MGEGPPYDEEMSIWEHLEELGMRLRRVVIVFIASLTITWAPVPHVNPHQGGDWASTVLEYLVSIFSVTNYDPLVAWVYRNYIANLLPSELALISGTVLGPLVMAVYVSLFIAALVTIPYAIYEIYKYVKPALYPHELIPVRNYLVVSVALFYLGVLAGALIVFPAFMRVTTMFSREFGVLPLLTGTSFIEMFIGTALIGGVLFETPVVVALLTRLGIITPQSISKNRPFIYAIMMILLAILTPDPTIVSPLIYLALFTILFESGYAWSLAIWRGQRKGTHS